MRARKRPVEVDAQQWFKNGDHSDDACRIIENKGEKFLSEGKVVRYFRHPDVSGDEVCSVCKKVFHLHGFIDTLEGSHTVCPGDWIITGVKGERYPCKPDIFDRTYDILDMSALYAPQVDRSGDPYVIFFDTETTGLPKNFRAPAAPDDNWPRMVQLAWVVYNRRGEQVAERSIIIRPDGFTIPPEASKIHGITQERALAEGMPLKEALDWFFADYKTCDHTVNHNADFDIPVLTSELLRIMYPIDPRVITHHCTKKASTDICRIAGPRGFKWPTLQELHFFLFGTHFENAHDALVDVRATARCFWELKRIHGIFQEVEIKSEVKS